MVSSIAKAACVVTSSAARVEGRAAAGEMGARKHVALNRSMGRRGRNSQCARLEVRKRGAIFQRHKRQGIKVW